MERATAERAKEGRVNEVNRRKTNRGKRETILLNHVGPKLGKANSVRAAPMVRMAAV